MCGIAGILDGTDRGKDRSVQLDHMVTVLAHRGPDNHGRYAQPEAGLWMGHRRLSIIDTSDAGTQPMTSRSGRHVMVFNGEIYNTEELSKDLDLQGAELRGHSDTEVLLELIDRHGIHEALPRCNGMFALALWDVIEKRLFLARDRVGIKPLYVGTRPGMLAFGSELRALLQLPDFELDVDRDVLCTYLSRGYVAGSASMVHDVRRLPPGRLLEAVVSRDGTITVKEEAWWSPSPCVCGDSVPDETADQLDRLLQDSVRLRLNADRPLGILLSGGIDSSLVTALATKVGPGTPRTFSIGFEQAGYDESASARSIAQHLGTDHVEHVMTQRDVLDLVPRMGGKFDEPFADSSQLPTSLVFDKASEDVVVCLTGDGGDELHCGYARYEWTMQMWTRMKRCPAPLRYLAGHAMGAVPERMAAGLGGLANSVAPRKWRVRNPSDKWRRASRLIRRSDFSSFYVSMVSLWDDPMAMIQAAPRWEDPLSLTEDLDLWHRMMLADFSGYLPDDILVKTDRTSMAVGVEARVPMLDHRAVELALSCPSSLKRHDGRGKWLLRTVLERYLPSELWDRPKQGFSVPLGPWLRGPLREWAEAMLNPQRLRDEGYFQAEPIQAAWTSHLLGRVDHAPRLWAILMFQAWLEANQ